MATPILDRLTYIFVLIYLVYIVVEGWSRLVSIY
jgi:hypothetical protein